ncbi:acyltransferase family protein [Pseudomonas sp. J452]|uniref:acyltransferase family protein n=1 Tax=Pseudomonas sp. J452 TaxID=2898441 RepID=UPI0021ADB7F8|nr:acyltransferase family protein [Pseudomonas sp. J452]UUY09839.1 acyltransferase family protein [Pseudomonas sp. J452]
MSLLEMTTPTSHLSHPKYRPDIDGLRAVAVLSVVAYHAFPDLMKGGFIGVDIFFVISGFLISTIIFENLDRGTFSFSEFYARRIRRIFPALILVLFSCLIFGWLVLIPDELNQLGKHIAAGAGFISNFILWSEAGYFDNSAETKPLLHLWSLGIEEQFYIVWPLALWIAWKGKFNTLMVTIGVALASFALNLKGIQQDTVATFYSPQTRFWELLSGSALAWFALYKKDSFTGFNPRVGSWLTKASYRDEVEADGNTLSNVISFFGLSLLVYGFWSINKDLSFPGWRAILPILGATLIIWAGPKTWINRKILSSKLAVWFGLISFPLYLWHWPILSFAKIIEADVPSPYIRIAAVVLSVVLAWITVKFLEKPFRFGDSKVRLKLLTLCGAMLALGSTGIFVSKRDFTETHGYEKSAINRKGFEHAFGSSLSWYRGKNDWLFLGNAHGNTVAKIKLSITPTEAQVNAVRQRFSKVADAGAKHGIKTILIIGPDKSSIYPEYLPDKLTPSSTKYSSFFFRKLQEIPNLIVYDPTNDLLLSKKSEGILYWMTDTHWNAKGAYLTYAGFSKLLNLPTPNIDFKQGSPHSGDLIDISKLKNFPLHPQDNWDVIWKEKPAWTSKDIPNEQETSLGFAVLVSNDKPLSNKYVWIVGDSFTQPLKPYFNATFKEVRYIGHWEQKLNSLPEELDKAERKPDLIVIVRVERSF